MDNARLSIPPPPEGRPEAKANVCPVLTRTKAKMKMGKVKILTKKNLYISHLEAQNEWFKPALY